jgi:hypothetical protein
VIRSEDSSGLDRMQMTGRRQSFVLVCRFYTYRVKRSGEGEK